MSIDNLDCDTEVDPVQRMVRCLSAKEITEWLIKYKDLPESQAENVESNIREQLKWQRLQGRLDRYPFLILLAKLWRLRYDVKNLERPKATLVEDSTS